MSQLSAFLNYMQSIGLTLGEYDFRDKTRCIEQKIIRMLDRTQSMFKWSGLPDSIPEYILERFLQTHGDVCFYKHNGSLYVFVGGVGDKPDVYYRPTRYIISNPALDLSAQPLIDKECVIMLNDTYHQGLLPLCREHATALVETELSMHIATINSRLISAITASDDRTRASAEKYLQDIADGKQGVIAETAFIEGLKVLPYTSGSNNTIISLIELMQYQKASWYNDLGLSANYNMKREALNSSETVIDNDILLPLIDDMLKCRKAGAEKVNAMYDTDIRVELSSSWEDNQEETEAEEDRDTEEEGGSDGETVQTE